ncbi:hypothetical protein ACN4EK_10000 [Pantanalinema rosaneae CENA516]|uniref:hypothetical protein n=1 Tax=Pantanalinema rosaneae TaxID=1620701 RepID=UPI003D6DC863
MSTQLHTQKQAPTPVSAPPLRDGFQVRPFTPMQPKEDEEHSAPDLKDQLSRAERFGHSLERVAIASPAPATMQAKAEGGQIAIQREEEEGSEEDSAQAKAEAAPAILQRQEEEGSEEDGAQAKAEVSPVQQSKQPVQFFIAMLLPMIMPMIQQLLPQLLNGILGGGGGGGAGGGGGGAGG